MIKGSLLMAAGLYNMDLRPMKLVVKPVIRDLPNVAPASSVVGLADIGAAVGFIDFVYITIITRG